MCFDSDPATVEFRKTDSGQWYRGLTRDHWFVFFVAVLGWLFDAMDQQIFVLTRMPAIAELANSAYPFRANLAVEETRQVKNDGRVSFYSGPATSIFMVGWALGGFMFGVLGDRIGRARTMFLTISLYSAATGLSAFSVGMGDFMLYRFLSGLGVGGEFAVGVALVAEAMPERARPFALGWVQALSIFGNMTAALISVALGALELSGAVSFARFSSWRIMFLIGGLPALLAILIRTRLKEPERWQIAAARRADVTDRAVGAMSPKLGSVAELFGDPRLRHNMIIGMLLAFSGVVGLWGIGFFSFDLIRLVFRQHFEAEGLGQADINARLNLMIGITSLVQNAGAFLGVLAFGRVTHYVGRRMAFAMGFLLSIISTFVTFLFLGRLHGFWDVFWMLPLMGFCQVSVFGGYAIYFPELFPTRLRSTGTSFCYNVGRVVASGGPSLLAFLSSEVYGGYRSLGPSWPMRCAGMTMCASYLIGLLALPFAPETRGQTLPD